MKTINLKECGVDGYPAHGQHILLMRRNREHLVEGVSPEYVHVEWSWRNINDKSETICYNGEDDMDDYEIIISFDGFESDPCDLWIDIDDFYDVILGHEFFHVLENV